MMSPQKITDDEALRGLDWESDDPQVLRDVLMTAGIWLPYSIYASWPVMLPWAVRDLASRPTGHVQGLDEWGAPNDGGYFRDDNSMVKGLVRGLKMRGPIGSAYEGRVLGTGFVAAHIWRFTKDAEQFTTRDPDLYSFAPNIVWLPKALAKRSDKEGGVVQRTLQTLSLELFRKTPVLPRHAVLVDACWRRLRPADPAAQPVGATDANWFVDVERFSTARTRHVHAVMQAVGQVLESGAPLQKTISRRYTEGLSSVDHSRLRELRARLAQFQTAG